MTTVRSTAAEPAAGGHPFGLGVLDLTVGKYVYDEVARSGELHIIDSFFQELSRYG